MKDDEFEKLNVAAQAIFDKKGLNILGLDVRGISAITDAVLIAEGNVDRHVIAIGHAVMDALEKIGERAIHTEGFDTGDWLVIDYGSFMVHLFMPGLREKYRLEELWRKGKIVDLKINVSVEEPVAYVRSSKK